MAIFQQLNPERGLTVVVVTHDAHIAHHTGRIVYLADGRITGEETVSEPLLAATLPGTSHQNGSR